MSTCFLNGDFLPLVDAKVSVLDRGFIFGDAIYEVIPVFAGKLFALTEHLDRLERNLREVLIPNPMSIEAWRICLTRLVGLNAEQDAAGSVYLQVTRGVAPRDHAFPDGVTPTVFAMFKRLESQGAYGSVSAVTLEDNRWRRCDIKTTSLLPNVLLRNQAMAAGSYEGILVRDGYVTEGAATNVFLVERGAVITPALSADLLPGVTRNLVVSALRAAGIEVVEEPVSVERLAQADEIWLTSSTREVVTVSSLNGASVGRHPVYPLAARARGLLSQLRDGDSGAQADASAQ